MTKTPTPRPDRTRRPMRRVRLTAAGRRLQTMLAQDAAEGVWRFGTVGGVDVPTKTLDAPRPNAGLAVAYRKRMDALLAEMQNSLVYWISAKYRARQPELLAQDASPAMEMRRTIRKLGRRWQSKFDALAPELADYFATAANERTDRQLQEILRKGGFSVRFKMTAAQNDVFQATVGENVALIKSIAQQHLKNVEGAVMRSVSSGRDLESLTKTLQEAYEVAKNRAATIARDQNNKATATMTRVRQKELGIKKAIWLHSSGGKTPRASHVAYSGKEYDIEKGAYIDGEWIFPGELINCRCVSKSIVPGFD